MPNADSPEDALDDSSPGEDDFGLPESDPPGGEHEEGAQRAPYQEPSGSLARYDPLQAYMREVGRYPVLDAEEQLRIAKHYQETGDIDDAAKLVTANLRLVVKIAYEYRRAYRNVLDLIQEGNIGLMQAVRKYDPYRGVKLSSYAAWWIRAYVLRFILNNWRLVKIGTTQAQRKLFFNLRKEKARLAALGIKPEAEILAKRLNVRTSDVEQMEGRLESGEVSLDKPVGDESGRATSRVEMLPAETASAEDNVVDEQRDRLIRERIASFGKGLVGKDALIFSERIMAEDPRTLQDLGDELGVSRERVRQLEKRIHDRLREYLTEGLDLELFR